MNTLSEAVRSLALAVGDAAARAGMPEQASAVQRRVDDLDTCAVPTIVVAGETKRGKSSMVNELIDHHDLSPVDIDIATALLVKIEAGPPGARVLFDGDTTVEMSIEEARSWMTVDAPGDPDDRAAVGAIVRVTAPILDHVSVLDTPGVGGMIGSHREVALAAVRAASALVFVVDAKAPISRPELDFLADAVEQISDVLFVLTKIDSVAGWREVMADDQRTIRRELPALSSASWHPVSSTRHATARRIAPADERDVERMIRDSGIPAVQEWIVDLASTRAPVLSMSNIVRHSQAVLGHTHDALVRREEMLRDRTDLERERRRTDDAAAGIEQRERRWRPLLVEGLDRVRDAVLADVHGELVVSTETNLQSLERRASGWQDLPRQVEAELDSIAHAAMSRYADGARGCCAAVLGDDTMSDTSLHTAIAAARAEWYRSHPGPVVQGERGGIDIVELLGNSVTGGETTQLVATFLAPLVVSRQVFGTAADLLFPGAGLLLGLGLTCLQHRRHARLRDQHDIAQWTSNRITEIASMFRRELAIRHEQLTHAVVGGVADWARERRSEIAASFAQLERLQRDRQPERERELRTVAEQRSLVASLTVRADAIWGELATGRLCAAPSGLLQGHR